MASRSGHRYLDAIMMNRLRTFTGNLRCAFLALTMLVVGILPHFASAQTAPDFQTWLDGVKSEAHSSGISDSSIAAAFNGIQPIPRVLELDRRQAEFTLTFNTYLSRVVTAQRVKQGREMIRQHAKALAEISRKYGVPEQVIVAMWGIESGYGKASGDFPIIASLATLAYDGRRSQYFRGELLAALRIVDKSGTPPSKMLGSWAGAMGQCQFMPSTYLKYAQSWKSERGADIWTNQADVFASTANYLSGLGWDKETIWGRQIRLPKGFNEGLIGLNTKKTLAEWRKLGVRLPNGKPLPLAKISASVIRADSTNDGVTVQGPTYLVYDNFRVFMKWNRSTFFALAAGTLADRLKNR